MGDTALSHGTPPTSTHAVCGPLTPSLHRGAGARGAFRPGALGEEMPVASMGARLLPGRQPCPWLWEHPLRQEVGTARPQRKEKHPWVRFIPGEVGAGPAPLPPPKVWDTLSESCLRCALAGRLGRPDGSQVLLATTPGTRGGSWVLHLHLLCGASAFWSSGRLPGAGLQPPGTRAVSLQVLTHMGSSGHPSGLTWGGASGLREERPSPASPGEHERRQTSGCLADG